MKFLSLPLVVAVRCRKCLRMKVTNIIHCTSTCSSSQSMPRLHHKSTEVNLSMKLAIICRLVPLQIEEIDDIIQTTNKNWLYFLPDDVNSIRTYLGILMKLIKHIWNWAQRELTLGLHASRSSKAEDMSPITEDFTLHLYLWINIGRLRVYRPGATTY